MKKLLASSLIALAAPTLLVTPADAARAEDWIRIELPCANGKGAAVLGYSPTHPWWGPIKEDGSADLNPKRWRSWYKNPCKGQWLITGTWHGDPSEGSYTAWSIGTGMWGHLGGADWARLENAPVCDVGSADRGIIAKQSESEVCPEG